MLLCVTLWIGERLGAVERACLRSVLRQGHRLELYCYSPPKGIPAGITLRDASQILPERCVFTTRKRSVAAFSDWFRYELQRAGKGTWIDTDMYLLRPLDERRPYLFGEEAAGVINNAVLRLPADSPMLPQLLAPFAGRTPYWLTPGRRTLSRVQEGLLGKAQVRGMPWGTTGPAALTAVANAMNLTSHAEPPETYYPVPWQQADWIVKPGSGLDEIAGERTVGVHLWNEMIKGFKDAPGPAGSFLQRLQREGAE